MMSFALFKATLAALGRLSHLVELQLRGVGDEGNDDGAEPADNVVFLQQLGTAARPVIARTLRALGLRYGNQVFALKVWDKTLTPTDLASGETRTFACGRTTVCIKHLADGNIRIEVDGGDVQLAPTSEGYAGKNVARVDDHVENHTHAAGTYLAGWLPVRGVSAPTRPKIEEGAPHVKA